jgi:hypothetical protein
LDSSNYSSGILINWIFFADEFLEGLSVTTAKSGGAVARKIRNQLPAVDCPPGSQRGTAGEKYCAYNQTRGRFLGVDIDAADFSPASFDDRMSTLAPKSDMGLWLVPFRGISATNVRIPFDLIYLDGDYRVIAVVESFPISRVSPSSPTASSVLALPSSTVSSTLTQRGDQLILCNHEEMKRRLERLAVSGVDCGTLECVGPKQCTSPSKNDMTKNSSCRVLQMDDRTGLKPPSDEPPVASPPVEVPQPNQQEQSTVVPEPAVSTAKPGRSWLQRFLNPEPPLPRKNARESLPGLAAFFWTGGTPERHDVRDISSTGFYVITEERWYLGTVVRMTLTGGDEPGAGSSISVNATVVRWGNDGVGVQFVLQNPKDLSRGKPAQRDGVVQGVDQRQLEHFIQRLKSSQA